MDPGSCSKDNDLSTVFKPTTPHFFKIILHETIRRGKIEIPKGFARNYGNELKSPVAFKVPSGATWPVELNKSDGEMWLEKGFSKFVEYYSLSHKDLLTFKYVGDSIFNVVIFDQSASEVGYPVEEINSDNKEPGVEDQSIQSDSVELIDDDEEQSIQSDSVELTDADEEKSIQSDSVELADDDEETFSRVCKRSKKGNSKENIAEKSCRSKIAKSVVIRRAEAKYKPQKTFYWVVMQPTYIHGSTQVAVLASFAKENISCMSGEFITLRTKSNEKTWKVKYYRHENYRPRMFGVGWKEFVQENNLRVGDACAFELIDPSDVIFMVTVVRFENHTNEISSLEHGKGAEQNEELNSNNPCFESTINSYNIVYIPAKIMIEFVNKKIEHVLLEVNNRLWRVNVLGRKCNVGGHLSSGFAAFAKDNSLLEGDICNFEIVNSNTGRIKVSIERKNR